MLGLGACQPVKETTTKETVIEKDPQKTAFPPPVPTAGPSDGGGGAGLEGKPLESYRTDIQTHAEYQKFIQPVINNLAKYFPRLATELLHVVKERTWYLIPGNIKKVPAVTMGVHDFTDYEQLAIQNMYEIYMDARPFKDKMNPEDRANLFLHEMVMGVRLLEYGDSLDNCLVEAKKFLLKSDTEGKHSEAAKDCYKKYPRLEPMNSKFHLNNDDYSSIRTFVGNLMTTQGVVDEEMTRSWLASHGFRNYK